MKDIEQKIFLPENAENFNTNRGSDIISAVTDSKKRVDESSSFHFTGHYADVASRLFRDFHLHVFCLTGTAKARYGDKILNLEPLDALVILNNGIFSWIETSSDFAIRGVFISNDYMEKSSPDVNYNTLGLLSMMDNPLLHLTKDQFDLGMAVSDAIAERVKQTNHVFYEGVLRRCVETLLLDLYDIHSKTSALQTQHNSGSQGMRLFHKFISMLHEGNYKTQREVRWYATELGITAKYLSEVCINASGHGASYWINRFTTEEIARLLHNPTMSIKTISDLMNFTTKSYFSHYVKERLGMTPKDYRLMILGVKK